ncbi:hypothetical protein [Halomonas rhizosphaerae]|uniref:Uncharacterized protein n=1 Tax=Halomonas rhizosphaerae TaxID=3043296 RepID=A0ABT6V0T6_9GAMM|nr:hypothetical protein [Halomonas rhizosphaerae]MDI5891834.1 hypothetical protein [Halomonas rhizosphaerae]
MPVTKVERERLYEQVWSRPMSHLAHQYGVSGQKLKEICERANIPTPTSGHWSRVAAGKAVHQPKLPKSSPESIWVTIAPTVHRKKKPAPSCHEEGPSTTTHPAADLDAVVPTKTTKSRRDDDLVVPAKLGRAHRIIAGWLTEHKQREEEAKQHHWINFPPTPFSPMDRRRHRILDTFLKAIENVGGKALEEERRSLAVELEGEKIPFQLREKQKQIRRPLTDTEKRWHRPGDKEWRQELQPTGKLIFEVKRYLPSGFKTQWLETDEIPMEELLSEIFKTLRQVAPILAQQTRERLEQKRLSDIAAHERYLAEQARKRDDNQWQRFLEIADTWQHYEHARNFLEVLKQIDLTPDCKVGEKALAEWICWVERRIQAGNPLNQGLEAIFSDIEKITSYTYSKKMDHWRY